MNTYLRKLLSFSVTLSFCGGLVCAQEPGKSAKLSITGDVPTPLTLSVEELDKLPRETVSLTDNDGTKASYEGVLLRELLQRAGAPFGKQFRGKNLASYVVAKAGDGDEVVFTLAEVDPNLGNETIVVADKKDGKAIPGSQGPLRLICAHDKEAARSVRMLEGLEVVRLKK